MLHAYPLEVIQAIGSAAATLILVWAIYDSAKALSRSRQDPETTEVQMLLARSNLVRGCFRVVKGMLFTFGGIAASLLPPPPPVPGDPQMQLAISISRAVLIIATALLLVDAFVERVFRNRQVQSLRLLPRPRVNGSRDYDIKDPSATFARKEPGQR